MRLLLRFWLAVGVWTALLLSLLLAVSFLSGQSAREVGGSLVSWLGLALALAAYPAGVHASGEVFREGGGVMRRAVTVALAAASVSVLLLGPGNFVAPVAQRWLASVADVEVAEAEPAVMTLTELQAAAREAAEQARSAAAGAATHDWLVANRLAWHYVRRTDGTALPFLLGIVGLLTGFWASGFERRELRQAQFWGVGLFLVMATYLVGENSYELIVLRSAGPVYFAGDLVLVVPALLALGMGWPTVVTLWQREKGHAGL